MQIKVMVPQKVKQGNPLSQEYNETNSQFAMEALIANNKYRVNYANSFF